MTRFSVDINEVNAAGAVVRRSVDQIRIEVAAMLGHLNNLQSTWTGGAAAAFTDVLAQWQATQGQVETGLDAITNALNQTAQTYQDAESAVFNTYSR